MTPKKAYYPVQVKSTTSKNNNIKKTSQEILVEVTVVLSDKGRCLITPVAGFGTASVLIDTVKLI